MTDTLRRLPGRPAHTLCGVTARQWAAALGAPTVSRLRRAQAITLGITGPSPAELVQVADTYGLDLGELVRAAAELRP